MTSWSQKPTTMGHSRGSGVKLTKPRGRIVVKPLLKKLHSNSDRGSLDLDRGWDDQPSLECLHHRSSYDCQAVSPSHSCFASSSVARSPRQASFSLSPGDLGVSSSAAAGGTSSHFYSHTRSTSATSRASIATSHSGVGRNGGSFVHPFQQTPQTRLSYAHSRASLDLAARDCSPTITEDDGDFDPLSTARPASCLTVPNRRSSSIPNTNIAGPALLAGPGSHHVVTSRSLSGPLHPPAFSSSSPERHGRPDVQLGGGASLHDASLSTTAPSTTFMSSPESATAASSCSPPRGPISPLRSSFDAAGFRLRSRSDLDASSRHKDHVREARRKFEAKERAKEERYAREQNRKRERASSKEAQKQERDQARLHRESLASLAAGRSPIGPRRSATTTTTTTATTATTATTTATAVASGIGLGLGLVEADEKAVYSGRRDDGPPLSSRHAPRARAEDVEFKSSRRTRTAKRKTVGVWTAFVLWLRTRLLKLGRR